VLSGCDLHSDLQCREHRLWLAPPPGALAINRMKSGAISCAGTT